MNIKIALQKCETNCVLEVGARRNIAYILQGDKQNVYRDFERYGDWQERYIFK